MLTAPLLMLALAACDDDSSSDPDNTPDAAVGAGGAAMGGAGGEVAGGAGGAGAEGGAGGEVAGGAGGEMAGGAGGVVDEACPAPPEAACDGQDEGPPRLNEHVATYDDARKTMIIFGGNTAVPENCGFPAYQFQDTTWLYYDYTPAEGCGRWVNLGSEGPSARGRHAAVFGDGAMWMFGGRTRQASSGPYQVLGDLWRFDPETRTWAEIMTDGPVPEGRYNHTLAYDANRDQLLLLGGNSSSSGANPVVLEDMWRYDIATNSWSEIMPTGIPPEGRIWHAATFDTARDQMLMYGGGDETAFFAANYYDDLWAFYPDVDTWERIDGDSAEVPDSRFWSYIVHDTALDAYVMFAGHDATDLGNRNDIWAFDPEDGQWSPLADFDRFNKPANGFCDFPPDFVIAAPGTPERRNAHSWVYSEACGRSIAFGGKTDCGAVNDVWLFEPGDGWTNPALASEGELCIRFRNNPDNCVNMCF
ncbi:MAG: kelch repeat-containing protein [Bradymonadia bacterium]